MAREFSNLKYVNDVGGYDSHGNKDYFYALFDCYIDPVSKRYLSEDYAFCKRWLGMNGEIWVDLSCNLSHDGTYSFKGAFLKSIERGIKGDNNQPFSATSQVGNQVKEQSMDEKLKALLGGAKSVEGKESKEIKTEPSVEERLKALLNKDSKGKLNKVNIV